MPLGDFFANVHGMRYNVTSLPVAVNPSGGFSYWPMPFHRHARITIESGYWGPITGFFYQITYALGPVSAEAATFPSMFHLKCHAQSRPIPLFDSPLLW